MADMHERRNSPRCNAVANQSQIQFPAADGAQRVKAELINLSREGALLVVESPAPCDKSVWVRIDEPVQTDWVRAVTVRLGRNREIALRFPVACPDDLFAAGTVGIAVLSSCYVETKSENLGDEKL